MHPCVHSNIIHASQNIEAAQESINRWTDKEGVTYLCIYVYTYK